ncbi:MAG: flavocytochrome c [Erysipelotrichaceae bacterium]
MKKLLVAVITALMLVSGCSSTSTSSDSACTAGTYTGTATGFGGEVTAEVTVSDSAITSVVLTGEGETAGIGSTVIDTFGEKFVAAQSAEVDALSGATVTSNAVMEAVAAALEGNCDTSKLVALEGSTGSEEITDYYDVDVVIIGAGGAGLTAAIEASDAGKSVLIVEIAAMTGGNSIRATGGMNAVTDANDQNEFGEGAGVEAMLVSAEAYPELAELAATVAQQYADYQANPEGYFDSVELFKLDTLVGGYNKNTEELVDVLVNNAGDAIDWLATKGVELTQVGAFGGASVMRIHKPVVDGKTVSVGAYMIPIMEEVATTNGVEILLETEATEILMTDGAASGIKAVKDGTEITVDASAVVVATGGFGANSDLVVSYRPDLEGFVTTNADTIQGDGIVMVEAVGGALTDIELVQIHPTVEQETGALITEGLRGDGAIMVNAEGLRFCDETGTRDVVSADIIAQTGGYAYLIVDQKMVDASSVIAGYITSGYTVEGETVEELAAAMGVDADNLVATMDAWNAAVAAGEDTEFGRTSFASALDTGSYYAIQCAPGVHHTMGGVSITTETEVLSTEGEVIPGLYAAGEVTGGIHGDNRLGGNAVADFVVFGRIAGQNAAAYVE